MQARLPSASTVGRVLKCLAAGVYDQTEHENVYSDRGTAGHEFLLVNVPRLGRDKALALAPPEWRDVCASIELDGLPLDEKAYAHEVALAWDHETDKGREVGRNIGRRYGPLAPTEYPGTADAIAPLGNDGVYVPDIKLGRMPPDDEQLMTLALLAARTYKRKWARCEFIFVPEHGEPYSRRWDMDALELDSWADTLRDLAAVLAPAREAFATAGIEPRAVIGEHCRFCSSLHHCRPSQLAVRTFVAEHHLNVEERLKALTPEEDGKAWLVVKQAETIIEEAKRVLKLKAELRPLVLPDGREVRIVTGSRRDLDADAVYQALQAKFGNEVALAAVPSERHATITSVVQAVGLKPGSAKAEALLAELEEAGAVRRATWPEAKIVRPELPATQQSEVLPGGASSAIPYHALEEVEEMLKP